MQMQRCSGKCECVHFVPTSNQPSTNTPTINDVIVLLSSNSQKKQVNLFLLVISKQSPCLLEWLRNCSVYAFSLQSCCCVEWKLVYDIPKCESAGRATYVIRPRQMCQLAKINKTQAWMRLYVALAPHDVRLLQHERVVNITYYRVYHSWFLKNICRKMLNSLKNSVFLLNLPACLKIYAF